MVPFWIPNIISHLISRYPKRDSNFDNPPFVESFSSLVSQFGGLCLEVDGLWNFGIVITF